MKGLIRFTFYVKLINDRRKTYQEKYWVTWFVFFFVFIGVILIFVYDKEQFRNIKHLISSHLSRKSKLTISRLFSIGSYYLQFKKKLFSFSDWLLSKWNTLKLYSNKIMFCERVFWIRIECKTFILGIILFTLYT